MYIFFLFPLISNFLILMIISFFFFCRTIQSKYKEKAISLLFALKLVYIFIFTPSYISFVSITFGTIFQNLAFS